MSLDRYAFEAHRVTQWYLTSVAVPGVETWARLIPMGEMAIGVALILGLLTLPTLIVSSLLVINYQIATGTLFSPAFFFSPYALLLLSTILILMFSKAGDRFSLDKFIFKKGSKR
jgi:thiosulfate dehydrogenase [quinone] large subunit